MYWFDDDEYLTPYQFNDDAPVHLRRRFEWYEKHIVWRRAYDSWEGGDRYCQATYGREPDTGLLIYNLVRHKHERPRDGRQELIDLPGMDIAARAGDGDFHYRRARTPAPDFVSYVAEAHLSKVYAHEVERDGPPKLRDWWNNVDGLGSTMDDWMQTAFAPLLLVMGQLDVVFGHPEKPKGATIQSIHDQEYFGLTNCVVSMVLPQNMVWWRLKTDGTYAECLVREPRETTFSNYRHWTSEGTTLYTNAGGIVEPFQPHGFDFVPIARIFDRRSPRHKNIGISRYTHIIQMMREFYNRDSELMLSDTHQAHPLIQGPEDYARNENDIPIGPTWLLPKKKCTNGLNTMYEGFDVVAFPKDGAESIRQNKHDMIDSMDRSALLTKPAGTAGAGKGTISQSGLSKKLDKEAGSDLLSKIATRLQAAETMIAKIACLVMKVDPGPDFQVLYGRSYDLSSSEELATTMQAIQQIIAACGEAPVTEIEMLHRLIRQAIPGLTDDQYEDIDEEIEAVVTKKAEAPDPPPLTYGVMNPPPTTADPDAPQPPKQIHGAAAATTAAHAAANPEPAADAGEDESANSAT